MKIALIGVTGNVGTKILENPRHIRRRFTVGY